MENTYWDQKGKYQAEYDRLVELMPPMGKCDTVAGELIRAASRLGHDLYNNGMGNNTSGAANFLLKKGAIDDSTYKTIYGYTRGQRYDGHYEGDPLQVAMERMVDQTIEFILANPDLETQANSEDIFDFSEDDQHWCSDCGDELHSRYSDVCGYCEDQRWQEEDEEEDCCH
jgi:hypothetical protein